MTRVRLGLVSLAVVTGCGASAPRGDTGSASGSTGSEASSGGPTRAGGSDAPQPYDRCTPACFSDGYYCPSCGGGVCGEGLIVCAADCDSTQDCPPAPGDLPIICHANSCFLDCASTPCPDEMICSKFGSMGEPVCFFAQ